MSKIIKNPIQITPATLADYPLIQNMARFYVYDLSRYCGENKEYDWSIPEDGLYWSQDYKEYFEHSNKKAFLVKTLSAEKDNGFELVGFVLIDEMKNDSDNYFEMGEFYIIAKFQKKGIGKQVAKQVWDMFPGKWQLSVMPLNKAGYHFWQGAICEYTKDNFKEEMRDVIHDSYNGQRIIFSFDTNNIGSNIDIKISQAAEFDIEQMVGLSYKKRRDYEKAQLQFWKWPGEEGEKIQARWFSDLLHDEKHIVLIAKAKEQIVGFIIGKLMPAPEVYNPGGLTLMVDDFCVEKRIDWGSVGKALIKEIKAIATARGAAQILVVCGNHDSIKCKFLENLGLTVATQWYVGNIT